ncbi:hypothetical protein J6590_042165 [Homalodisca vitripennis]|nr:hypothetical protein J6590_042165 [Homalodisca vitripennis]
MKSGELLSSAPLRPSSSIITIVEFLIDNLEAGNTSTAILLDFSKVLDCLDYTQLINKMKNYCKPVQKFINRKNPNS